MFLIVVLSDVVVKIPMAALVAVMIMVSIGTFDWSSLKGLRKSPLTDSIVMVVTVITVVLTDDLSKGVFAGVLLSAVFFVAKISKLKIISHADDQKLRTYKVKGQIFFASVSDLMNAFMYREDIERVVIDLSEAHVWDDSGVAALGKIVAKFKEQGIEAELKGLNEASQALLKQMA